MHPEAVGSIERFRRSNGHRAQPPAPAPRRSGGSQVAVHQGERSPAGSGSGAEDVGFVGRPVEYQPSAFSLEESWQLLSGSMRQWAQLRAGEPIRDPHTGVPTVYAYCRVTPEEQIVSGGPTPATYELVLFGKRGLVVSDGTTDDLVHQAGVTKWRHRRFDLPIDPSAIRNDHRRGIAGNSDLAAAGAGAGGLDGAGPAGAAPLLLDVRAGSELLPSSDVAEMFGNLPLATQRFLLEPFTSTGRAPTHARVHPAVLEQGSQCRELYWTCLFNAGWLAFATAERSVHRPPGHHGPNAWLGAVEELRHAPWTVAAWVAPVDKAAGAVSPAAPAPPLQGGVDPGPFDPGPGRPGIT